MECCGNQGRRVLRKRWSKHLLLQRNQQNEDLEKWSVTTMTFKSPAICILWKVLLNSTKNRILSFVCMQKILLWILLSSHSLKQTFLHSAYRSFQPNTYFKKKKLGAVSNATLALRQSRSFFFQNELPYLTDTLSFAGLKFQPSNTESPVLQRHCIFSIFLLFSPVPFNIN